MITDEMIEEWITVRVEALKKTAWWNVHGELFTEMFNEVKDFDLRCNVRKQGSYYDSTFREYRPVTHIRKRGEGRFGQPGYKMASIVWRWNHPDNQANQQRRKGYPNNKLYNDLMMFKFNIEEAKRRLQEQDDIDAERVATLKKHDDNQRKIREAQRQRRNKVVSEIEQVQHLPAFIEACEYYGLEPFVPEQGRNTWEENFLSDIKAKMIRGTILTDKQMTKLNSVFTGEKIVSQEATQKQKDYLIRLGFEGDIDNLTKDEASTEITILKTSKWGIQMAEGKKTIGDLKKEVKGLTDKNTELTEQLQQLSDGYQAAMMQLNQLGMLNNRYVETICHLNNSYYIII